MGNRLTRGLGGRGHSLNMLGGGEGEVNVRWHSVVVLLCGDEQNRDRGRECLILPCRFRQRQNAYGTLAMLATAITLR